MTPKNEAAAKTNDEMVRAIQLDEKDKYLLQKYHWYVHSPNKRQYYAICDTGPKKKRKRLFLHRIIAGAVGSQIVDHIDGNTLNNKRSNLRLCNRQQNNCNARGRKGTSKYKGVHFDKSIGYWRAAIKNNGERFYASGVFRNEKDAAIAYDQLAKLHHGEFAYLNFPTSA